MHTLRAWWLNLPEPWKWAIGFVLSPVFLLVVIPVLLVGGLAALVGMGVADFIDRIAE